MPSSVIEAIQLGIWDFEPDQKKDIDYDHTQALPGSPEKLDVLAARLREGSPLWHPDDRRTYRDNDAD